MEKWIRKLQICVRIFPRHAQLLFVIDDIFVSPVTGENVRGRCAAVGGFETCGAGDQIVRGNPAVTPTAHTKTIGIDQAGRNRGIDRREIVLEIDTPPCGEDAEGEFFATTSGAARIRHDDSVTVGGKNLHPKLALTRKLRFRPAVRWK